MILKGYHATSTEFESFAEEKIGSNKDTHINSHLGIWFFSFKDPLVQSSFGSRVIEADLKAQNPYNMKISKLYDLSQDNDLEFFKSMRKNLISKGHDIIKLSESQDFVSTYIALETKNILKTKEIVSSSIKNKKDRYTAIGNSDLPSKTLQNEFKIYTCPENLFFLKSTLPLMDATTDFVLVQADDGQYALKAPQKVLKAVQEGAGGSYRPLINSEDSILEGRFKGAIKNFQRKISSIITAYNISEKSHPNDQKIKNNISLER